jgi:hypothetical protein
MKVLIFVATGLLCWNLLLADEPNYAVNKIPPELLENADAVVRDEVMVFHVKDPGHAVLTIRKVVTLLNQKADRHGQLRVNYDKLSKIKFINFRILDANGKEIKKIRSTDILDQSAVSGVSLYEDNRMKVIKNTFLHYPVTVEYELEKEYNSLLHYPGWEPLTNYRLSVEKAEFQVRCNPGMKVRYKDLNNNISRFEETRGNQNIYQWKIDRIAALKESEPMVAGFDSRDYKLLLAPEEFEYDGYSGKMSSWEEFGYWVYHLNLGRDQLPENDRIEVLGMIEKENTDLEKVQSLYRYLQNKTRYISIQLGIGGYQPFDAATVSQTGYGDCKALTNYMFALLKAAGIHSIYTLVKAGSGRDLEVDFPSSQFNHAILCVPLQSDTIWLECTSQTNPFGYIGHFTDNRHVLLITEKGGKIVKTRTYPKELNRQVRKAELVIEANGNVQGKLSTLYEGLLYDQVENRLHLSPEEQKKEIYEKLGISNVLLKDFYYQNRRQINPAVEELLNLQLKNYGTLSGKRLFLEINPFSRFANSLSETETRINKVVTKWGWMECDSLHYQVPKGYYNEYLPDPVVLENDFGYYEAHLIQNENGISYIRKLEIKKSELPPERFNELVRFFQQVEKADKAKIVLQGKT